MSNDLMDTLHDYYMGITVKPELSDHPWED